MKLKNVLLPSIIGIGLATDGQSAMVIKTNGSERPMITKNRLTKMDVRYQNEVIQAIEAETIGTIVLRKGTETKVEIAAVEDELTLIRTTLKAGKLKIHVKKGAKVSNVTVYVTLKDSDLSCRFTSVGEVLNEGNLNFEKLVIQGRAIGKINLMQTTNLTEITATSVGNLVISGSATTLVTDIQSFGTFDASALVCQKAEIKGSAVNQVFVHVAATLFLQVHACSEVRIQGSPKVDKSKSDANLKVTML